jgi:lipopolysaccharide transport system permease protein
LEILPVVIMGSGLVNALISLLVLIAGLWLVLGSVSSTFMFVVLMMLPLIGYALGLSWFFSSLGVFVRDLNPIMLVAIRMLFYLSAVFYPITRVPQEVQHVLQLNPLVGIIDNFRRVVMWNEAPDWTSWAGVTAISFVVMLLGYAWFMKTKRAFADVL